MNSFTETTNQNFGSRIKDSCGGICIGLLLFFGSIPFLFWNEGRAVDRYETLEEGQLQTVTVSSALVDPTNDGRLVHFTAEISSNGSNLTDPVFGISSTDIKLRRESDMYQWQETTSTETRNKVGGGTETVTKYDYSKIWSPSLISSSSFRNPGGHENPASFPYETLVLQQDTITAGEYVLPEEVVDKLTWFEPIIQSDWDTDLFSDPDLANYTDVLNNRQGYYVGLNKDSSENLPTIGDSRVEFSTVEPETISVVAQQNGNNLARWQAKESEGSLLLFQKGNFTAEEMFAKAEAENQATTWLFRFLGFVIMAVGIYLILSPIQVFADVIPILGDIVGCGLCTVAVVFAMFFSGITISVAWLVSHPMIGGLVLLGIVLLTGGIFYFLKKRKDANGSSNNTYNDNNNNPVAPPGKTEQPVEPDVEVGGVYKPEPDIPVGEPDIPIVDAEPVEEVPFGSALGPTSNAPKPYVPKPYVSN